jgi:hypothetical protein
MQTDPYLGQHGLRGAQARNNQSLHGRLAGW